MYGQLNLFTFTPRVKVFNPTPITLNRKLWELIRKTDPRGYTFGSFDQGFRGKKGLRKYNKQCATVVLYKGRSPIGFCTISLPGTYRTNAYLDVWVMPYYRDLGFGSLLINRSNVKCFKLTGKFPDGFDKNHTHCWDARFRKKREDYNYIYPTYDQLPLPFGRF